MTQEKANRWKLFLCLGIFIWFITNLLQGIFTEIHEDEAYYALYGENLAWGYFDHPPMVGLMTFLSSILFSGTLGVRFFTIIVSCLTLFVAWKIVDEQSPNNDKVLTFFTITFSIVMLNVYGFITTPDASLILFSSLFLLVYQSYLKGSTWPKALLMGLLMALMMYSKYHAALLLALIVLSNLSLLKDGRFWVAAMFAILLYVPHILWQFEADFPSLKYHLIQRNSSFRWSYLLEYLPNQLLVFNPLVFGAMVYLLVKHRPKDAFERGLYFIIIGFFVFFFFSSFRGHVEPHWTMACAIPVVVLIYRKCQIDLKLNRFISRIVLPSILLIVVMRVLLLTPAAERFGFYEKHQYYKAIEEVAGDKPVVFPSSFQKPSLYHFFTGKEASTVRPYYMRKTQFDLWQKDLQWLGDSVFICGDVYSVGQCFHKNDTVFDGYMATHFQSANRLSCQFRIINSGLDEVPVLHHGDTLFIDFSIENPSDIAIDFQHDELSMVIKAQYLKNNDFCFCKYDNNILIEPHSAYQGHLFTVVGDDIPTGDNRFALGIGDRVISSVTDDSCIDVVIK